MAREMFVGCVDVKAHCKPVHNACSIDDLCIGFRTYTYTFIEGSLNSKLPTIWRVEKQIDEVKSEESKVRR